MEGRRMTDDRDLTCNGYRQELYEPNYAHLDRITHRISMRLRGLSVAIRRPGL